MKTKDYILIFIIITLCIIGYTNIINQMSDYTAQLETQINELEQKISTIEIPPAPSPEIIYVEVEKPVYIDKPVLQVEYIEVPEYLEVPYYVYINEMEEYA